MEDLSRVDPWLPSEGAPTEAPPTDLIRLNRRQFLRGGAQAVSGMAALSGTGLIHAPSALAQQAGGPVVSRLLLLGTSATRVNDDHPTFCDPDLQLLVGRHAYRFDYQFAANSPQKLPADLVATYRDGLCDIDNELQRV